MNYLWLIFALLSAISAALVAVFGKMGLQGIDSNTATALRSIIMAVFLFLVVTFEGKLNRFSEIVADKRALLFITLSGLAGAMSWLFYFIALKTGKVQQVAPVDKLSVVFAIVLAAVFLGEKVSWLGAFGVLLITAGVIMVALG